jgi:PAS domain S-box-containing protein
MGVDWHIKIIPTPAQVRANTSALPGIVLLFGVSVSVLLGIALSFYNLSRASEHDLKKAFEWNKAGIDSTSLLIIALDENTLVREMNSAAEKMLGYETAELAGKASPLMFYDPIEVRAFQLKMEKEIGHEIKIGRDFMDALFQLGLHRATEWTQISRSGERYTVINSTSEIRDDRGNLTGYLQILEDVTELKHKEELLKEQELKIVASSRLASLGEMAAGIAHEINNPLAIINGHAMILKKNLQQKGLGEDSEIVKKVEAIESVVQRIAKIIKGLRSFARETDSKDTEEVSVEALMEDTLSFSRERFRSDGVELITRIPADLKIKCQPHQISQVILNLLNNALDAVQNSKNKSVIIEAIPRQDGIEISVSDSGPGVPYDIRNRIMQPFFTTKEVGKGVGLGLSISQGIIQGHNGKFYLDENSARTRFVIWLPA